MFSHKLMAFVRLWLLVAPLSIYGLAADEEVLIEKTLIPSPPLPTLLDGTIQPKFVNPLVNVVAKNFIFRPHSIVGDGIQLYKIKRVPFMADVGIIGLENQSLLTPMFGYAARGQPATFPGRTFIVNSKTPIKVFWKNKLLSKETHFLLPLPYYVPADLTIHTAKPNHPPYPESGVPTVVHLHGGFTEATSDGYPEAWNTPNFAQFGSFFKKKVFTYSNAQQGTLLWYHDHALGFTRLNNYTGLAGAYVIRDKNEKQLIRKHRIPSGSHEVPLIITDRMFTATGELFFPYFDPTNPQQPQPSALPEFFGDFMLVNGKVWPFLEVEPGMYRLRILNACDSRFLDLHFAQDPNTPSDIGFYQIGTDQGFLSHPVSITHLLLAPGQRADLVIDFSHLSGQTATLTNTANAPYPDGDPVNPLSTALVMQFRVTKPVNTDPVRLAKKLRNHPIRPLHPTAPVRQVLLFETADQFARIMPMLGTPDRGALMWSQPPTETPRLGSTEMWEIYNTTADAHPIHLHAGDFQIVDRQYFSGTLDPTTGVLTNISMLGNPIPPSPAEHGLFDTVIVPPGSGGPVGAIGQRTRIVMKFTLRGHYVWHCHILSHEDNEMMRPLVIQKRRR